MAGGVVSSGSPASSRGLKLNTPPMAIDPVTSQLLKRLQKQVKTLNTTVLRHKKRIRNLNNQLRLIRRIQ